MRPVIVCCFVCSSFGYPSLQGGVPSGRASDHSSWGLGGLHRSEGCLLPRPIAEGARKHLQFGWGGHLYQSCVLSFGLSPGGFQDQSFPARLLSGPGGGVVSSSGCARLSPCFSLVSFLILGSTSSAPRMFTLMAKRVKAELGRLGIRTIFYLDVVLVLGSSFQFCLSVLQEALSLLMKGDSSSTGRSPALS
jgi:hypothetical protein